MKKLIFLIFLGAISNYSFAQKLKIVDNDSLLLYYLQHDIMADTSSDATILFQNRIIDIGFEKNTLGGDNPLIYTNELCYKINKEKTSNLGQITIPYSNNIAVKNFNLVVISFENGQLVKEKIEKSDLLKETLVKNVKAYKLNISNLKKGSIIYFTYSYKSELNSRDCYKPVPIYWEIQGEYPIVESRFELQIPNKYSLSIYPRNIDFPVVKTREALDTVPLGFYSIADQHQKRLDQEKTTFVWKCSNIGTEVIDKFIIHPFYYEKRIDILFQMPARGGGSDITFSWKQTQDSTKAFDGLKSKAIGEYKLDDSLNLSLVKRIKTGNDSLQIAEHIYQFVRDSVKSVYGNVNNYITIALDYNSLLKHKQAYSLNNNKLLTFLLRKSGFTAFNVLLSTNSEVTEKNYESNKVNYLITVVYINGNRYFLDAGFKYLPFGTILPKCYNGFAWIIDNDGTAVNLNAGAIEDKNNVSCSMMPNKSSANFDMQLDQRLGKYSGALLRATLHADSADVKDEMEANGKGMLEENLIFKDYKIMNQTNIEEPLKITYTLEYPQETIGTFMYINPFFSKVASYNTFKNVTRHYPVEYDIPPNKRYLLKMQLPEGYTLDESIEEKTITFQHGLFIYNQSAAFDETSQTLNINYLFVAKTNLIPAKDYEEFRNFYEQIIAEQNKKIVLKKK